jgi:hypothetical protein
MIRLHKHAATPCNRQCPRFLEGAGGRCRGRPSWGRGTQSKVVRLSPDPSPGARPESAFTQSQPPSCPRRRVGPIAIPHPQRPFRPTRLRLHEPGAGKPEPVVLRTDSQVLNADPPFPAASHPEHKKPLGLTPRRRERPLRPSESATRCPRQTARFQGLPIPSR